MKHSSKMLYQQNGFWSDNRKQIMTLCCREWINKFKKKKNLIELKKIIKICRNSQRTQEKGTSRQKEEAHFFQRWPAEWQHLAN